MFFEKCVQELKTHCDEESICKQRLIDQEQDINNLVAVISLNKEPVGLPPRLNTEPQNEDLSEDKEVMGNQNQNTSLISNRLKDKEAKLASLKKAWEKNVEKLKELAKKRDHMMNNFYKSGIKDFYFEYLQSILKAHNAKLFIMENRFKEKFNNAVNSVKESYIAELENQVRFRDAIIAKENLELVEDEKLKSVEQLKKEYSNKLPMILPSRDNSISRLNSGHSATNLLVNNNLPPINMTNFNSILSDVKALHNNISRIEREGGPKKEKSRRNESYLNNPNTKENKHTQARNYSQGIRHNIINNNGNGGNNQNNLLRQNYPSKKNAKLLNINKKLNKDSMSEKSVNSNNVSNEQDSETIDIENSGDESNVRRLRNNHFKGDRKSANHNHGRHYKEESPSWHSPIKKEFPKFMNNIKREESISRNEGVPFMKKKDLNVFLNDRVQFRSKKKMPFKI